MKITQEDFLILQKAKELKVKQISWAKNNWAEQMKGKTQKEISAEMSRRRLKKAG